MFDIGFAELVILAVVALLVIGPERLPGAIRTGSAWLNRIRRGFNEVKQEVQQELHNDAVMQELKQLRDSGDALRADTQQLAREFQNTAESAINSATGTTEDTPPPNERPKEPPADADDSPLNPGPTYSQGQLEDSGSRSNPEG
ncbi:MAG: Sec-independent protein translocase protein TatB [Pseudomonadota bacterium]